MKSKEHWENVYSTKATNAVSWFQEHPEESYRLILQTGVPLTASIIDVGGGTSTLVDDLMANGYKDITVLDISAAALTAAKNRLGKWNERVHWLEANITEIVLPIDAYDVWHDRAVFHFLSTVEDRQAYVRAVQRTVKPGGHIIIATFAEDGPFQCSGLPVVRYGAKDLHAEFGESFELVHHEKEAHQTPLGTIQQFVYCYCRKIGS